MSCLHLADDLALPVDAVTETFALLAARGAGKSNAARVLAEEMFRAGLPFVAVDPVGSWWGLRSSRDGKGAGLAIPIFGGKHGDVPLERSGGTVVADLIAEQRLSCVLDLTEFDSEAGKKAFLLDFARRLYQKNEQPLHLFLEEADDYIPQRPMRDEAQLLRAWENIVRRGRSRGLGMTMITQRSASINKSVLTQCGTLIALRTTGPQDRAAIEDWLHYHDQSREIVASLPSLADGEAWVWSPQFLAQTARIRFRLSETFDSGATPKVAASQRAPTTLADVDLSAIREQMAATIERAKEDDPKLLRQRIAALERQVREQQPERIVERVEIPVLGEEERHTLTSLVEQIDVLSTTLESVQREVLTRLHQAPSLPLPPEPEPPKPVPHYAPRATPANTSKITTSELTAPQQRILDALACFEQVGNLMTARANVAVWADQSPRSSGYTNNLGRLRTLGLVDYPLPGLVTLTDRGRELATCFQRLTSLAELHHAWYAKLSNPQARILQMLVLRYPASMSRAGLAEEAGQSATSSGYTNNLGALRGLGLLDYPKSGWVVATDLLFPEGLG